MLHISVSLTSRFLDILDFRFFFLEANYQQKEELITHAVELPRSNKSRSCSIWFKEAEVVWDTPGEERTCGGGTGGPAWTGEARLTERGRAGGSVGTSTELPGWGDKTDAAEADSVDAGVDNPGRGKAVDAVGVGALAPGRTSAKNRGEERAGTADEMSKRSTSWLDAGNAWLKKTKTKKTKEKAIKHYIYSNTHLKNRNTLLLI